MLAGLAVIGQLAYNKWSYDALQMTVDNRAIANLIIQTVESVRRDAVVDALKQQVYIPEARLVLPLYDTQVRGLTYSYAPASADNDEYVQLTTRNAVDSAIGKLRAESQLPLAMGGSTEKSFDLVAKLQHCNRGMEITLSQGNPKAADVAKDGQVTLADGRTARFTFNECDWQPDAVADYFKQIKSY